MGQNDVTNNTYFNAWKRLFKVILIFNLDTILSEQFNSPKVHS